MFAGLSHAREQTELPVRVRSRLLSLATVLLVVTLVVTSIAGFIHVSTQQRILTDLRVHGEHLRSMYQSLIEADADAMHFLTGETGALRTHLAHAARLAGPEADIFGEVAPVSAGKPIPDLVQQLVADWTEAIGLATAGNGQAGLTLLTGRHTGETLTAIGTEVGRVLSASDARLALHDERIQVGTLLVLVLQLGAGLLAILGLLYAFRSSASEADGRAAVVASADRSREQVARLFEMADVLQSAADHADANAVLKATAIELVPAGSLERSEYKSKLVERP